jgi:hypothetical protein
MGKMPAGTCTPMYVAAPAGFQPNGSVFTPSHYQLPISQDEKCLYKTRIYLSGLNRHPRANRSPSQREPDKTLCVLYSRTGLRIEAAEQPLMAQLDVGNIIRSSPVSFGFGEHPFGRHVAAWGPPARVSTSAMPTSGSAG